MGYMAVIATIGYVMIFASGLMPGKGMGKFVVLMIGYMLCNFGQYCYYLIMMISIMNTVEYNELKFGSRDEGIITSLRPFITKLGGAIIVAVTSARIYFAGGYRLYQPDFRIRAAVQSEPDHRGKQVVPDRRSAFSCDQSAGYGTFDLYVHRAGHFDATFLFPL